MKSGYLFLLLFASAPSFALCIVNSRIAVENDKFHAKASKTYFHCNGERTHKQLQNDSDLDAEMIAGVRRLQEERPGLRVINCSKQIKVDNRFSLISSTCYLAD